MIKKLLIGVLLASFSTGAMAENRPFTNPELVQKTPNGDMVISTFKPKSDLPANEFVLIINCKERTFAMPDGTNKAKVMKGVPPSYLMAPNYVWEDYCKKKR